MAFRIARHLALMSRTPFFSLECLSGVKLRQPARSARSEISDRPARNQIVTVPGNISPAPEMDRSNSTERAKTDCLRKRECAIPRSSRKRCLPSARHQAVLSARKLNQQERASKLTPLRSLPCASRACPSYRLVGFDTRKLIAPRTRRLRSARRHRRLAS